LIVHKKNSLLAGAAAMVAAALGTVALGQTAAGPFTQAQVDAGRRDFGANCAQCHNPDLSGSNDAPQLAGDAFIGAWKGRTTQALYNKISKTMPPERGGTLDEATYTAIAAYILHANGATAGSTAFTPITVAGIGTIASGKVPDDVLHPPAMSAVAAPAASMRVPGSFMLPSRTTSRSPRR
jgi:mono/diheme cytochrome c family protein